MTTTSPTQGEHAQTEALRLADALENPINVVCQKTVATCLRRLHAQVAALTAAPADADNLRKALQFYADGHHFVMHDETAWDTVSGEPVNFYEDEAGTATVEDGSIAKLALAGHPIKFEDEDAPAQPAAPQGVAYAEPSEFPAGAIVNGRTHIDRLESFYRFDCEAGPLINCDDWHGLKRCFEHLAERASHGQAPAGAANTKTHELLSTTVGLLMGYREGAARQPYKPGSMIAKVVDEVVDHLKDWPYPEPAPTAQAEPAADLQPNFTQLRKALADRRFRGETDLQDLVNMAANIITEDGDVISGQRGIIDKLKAAPAAGAVAGPVTTVPLRELGVELRKAPYCLGGPQLWALHRNGSLIRYLDQFENDFVDSALLATAPTPAAQADSQPAPVLGYPPLPHELTRTDRGHLIQRFRVEALMRAYVDADRAARKQGGKHD